MADTVLVATDFTAGLNVVQALERSNFPLKVALWLYFWEHEDWRLVLASPRLDEVEGAKAYGLLREILDAEGISGRLKPTLTIMRMSDPFIRALRRTFSKAKGVEGMRLGKQLIGDRWVEEALVYRIR